MIARRRQCGGSLKFPVLFDGLDGPLEFLAQGFGEELLDGNIELLAEDDGKSGVDIVLSNQQVSR